MSDTSYSKNLFLTSYSYNAVSTSFFSTSVVSTESGYEKRNANWEMPLHEFTVSYDVLNEEKQEYIKNFHTQHRAMHIAFKFKDWSDYKCRKEYSSINKGLGLNGKPYAELYKVYKVDDSFEPTYRRIRVIAKLSDEPYEDLFQFKIFFDGVEKQDVTIDYDNGLVYFNALSSFDISSISNSNPAIVTTNSNHDFKDGDKIWISEVLNGDKKVNDKLFSITKLSDNSFSINYSTINFGSLSGGKASKYMQDSKIKVTWEGCFYCKARFAEDTLPVAMSNINIFQVSVKIKEIK